LNKNKTSVNTVIIVLGVLLVISLTWVGYNSNTKTLEIAKTDSHNFQETPAKGPMMVSDTELNSDANLDEVVDLAVKNMEKGKETGDMNLAMNEGVMKLLAVVKRDSNHVNALKYLGLFALESGQFEKAEKRFEKLLLLQPENQEYKNKLQEIRKELEHKH
jgi:tetratricopeptide (TPR) repeat protein